MASSGEQLKGIAVEKDGVGVTEDKVDKLLWMNMKKKKKKKKKKSLLLNNKTLILLPSFSSPLCLFLKSGFLLRNKRYGWSDGLFFRWCRRRRIIDLSLRR